MLSLIYGHGTCSLANTLQLLAMAGSQLQPRQPKRKPPKKKKPRKKIQLLKKTKMTSISLEVVMRKPKQQQRKSRKSKRLKRKSQPLSVNHMLSSKSSQLMTAWTLTSSLKDHHRHYHGWTSVENRIQKGTCCLRNLQTYYGRFNRRRLGQHKQKWQTSEPQQSGGWQQGAW